MPNWALRHNSLSPLIIDLKKVRFQKDTAALLRAIKDSGSSKHDTFAPLVRLYVLMGLSLHKHGIHTVEQLEAMLKRASEPELEKRVTDRVLLAFGAA